MARPAQSPASRQCASSGMSHGHLLVCDTISRPCNPLVCSDWRLRPADPGDATRPEQFGLICTAQELHQPPGKVCSYVLVISRVQKLSCCTNLVCAATGWIEPERGSNDTGEHAEERAGPGKCYGAV